MIFWKWSRRKNNKEKERRQRSRYRKGKAEKTKLSKPSKPPKCVKQKLLQYRKKICGDGQIHTVKKKINN